MNFSRFARPYTWMTDHALWREAVREMARHLPPSAAQLRLLDIGCGAGTTLRTLKALRPDIFTIGLDMAWGMLKLAQKTHPGAYLMGNGLKLPFPANSFDAILVQRVYFFLPHKDTFLAEIQRLLRPGGRVILIDPMAGKSPWSAWRELKHGRAALDMFGWHLVARSVGGVTLTSMATDLQTANFARILTEPIVKGWGVLSRGEKPYPVGTGTLSRIAVGASGDTSEGVILQGDEIQNAPGRFLHLLIHQTPNKPGWALDPNDVITWGAVAALPDQGQPLVLAFSALPKAVAFMQAAVLAGKIKDVSKVAKFSKNTAWDFPIILNPSLEQIQAFLPGTLIALDPSSAETGDE